MNRELQIHKNSKMRTSYHSINVNILELQPFKNTQHNARVLHLVWRKDTVQFESNPNFMGTLKAMVAHGALAVATAATF